MATERDQSTVGLLTRLRASAPPAYVRRTRREWWAIALGLIVLVACMVVVWDGELGRAEREVFLAVNGLPDALQAPMWVFQLLGSLAFVALAGIVAATVRRFRLAIALVAAIPLKLALEWWVVKALVERERPALTVADAVVREVSSEPLGFPSGHSIFAFTMAGLFAPYLGRRGVIAVYGLAVLNGVGRMYLGAHNLLDLVAGAGLGVALGAALNLAVGVPKSAE